MPRILSLPIETGSGRLLRDVLQKDLHVSSALLSKLKRRDGAILVNGERSFVSRRVFPGDVVAIDVSDPPEAVGDGILPVKGEVNVLFEDEDLLVFDKAPYVPVHPTRGHYDDTLANFARHRAIEKGEDFVFRAVNRLDRNTSGLLAAAKNAYIHERLISCLKSGNFLREYLAVASGEIPSDAGVIDAPIARAPGSSLRREVSPEGKRAITEYEVLERRGGMTLLSLRLLTGRTHQIRVHLFFLGHPLVSDFLYGGESEKIARHPLHAAQLSFLHPVTNKWLRFSSPMPEDMRKLFFGI